MASRRAKVADGLWLSPYEIQISSSTNYQEITILFSCRDTLPRLSLFNLPILLMYIMGHDFSIILQISQPAAIGEAQSIDVLFKLLHASNQEINNLNSLKIYNPR